jgi:hypothetical protein
VVLLGTFSFDGSGDEVTLVQKATARSSRTPSDLICSKEALMSCKGIVVLTLVALVSKASMTFPRTTETCRQTIHGTWDVRIWSGESADEQCRDQCVLTVLPDDTVAGAGSCFNCAGTISSITEGQLAIFFGCLIDWVIETESGRIDVVNGGIFEDTMFFGRAD